MFPRDRRVQSVRDRTLTEIGIGASIKRKLYELEAESGPARPGHASGSGRTLPLSPLAQGSKPLPMSPLAQGSKPLPISPLARVQLDSQRFDGATRKATGREKTDGFRGFSSFKNKRSFKKSFTKARAMTLKRPIGGVSSLSFKKNRIMSLKRNDLNRARSVKDGGFNRVVSINKKQLHELTGEEGSGDSDSEDQYTVIIQRNDPSDIWSVLAENDSRLSSMRTFRFSSIRRWPDSDDSEDEEEVDPVGKAMWQGYLTREEQYELRKKIFHKGEYMILNYALILLILLATFCIIFMPVWHTFQKNDIGMYVMLGVALTILLTVVILVKIRLRLARRAPGGYKFRRDEKSTVIDNVNSERDVEASVGPQKMYDMLRNSYLTIYNSVVWLGYFYVFFVSLLRVLLEGPGAVKTNYAAMSWLLRSCQQTVFLEIIHAATGLTKTSTLATVLQTGDYKLYPHSTHYKTVPDYKAWDRVNHTSCDLHINTAACYNEGDVLKNRHCGDCDYEMGPGVWYKFGTPNDRIVVLERVEECPPQGHCNGYYSLTLLPSNQTDLFYLVKSGHADLNKTRSCVRFGDETNVTEMVQVKKCPDGVILYKFPPTYPNKTTCSDKMFNCDNGNESRPLFTPASWCLTGPSPEPTSTVIPGPVPTPIPTPKPKPTDADHVSNSKKDFQKVQTIIGINSAASFLVLLVLILFAAYKCHTRKNSVKPGLHKVESRPGTKPDPPAPDPPGPDPSVLDSPGIDSLEPDLSGPVLPELDLPAGEPVPDDLLPLDFHLPHQYDLPDVRAMPLDLEAARVNLPTNDAKVSGRAIVLFTVVDAEPALQTSLTCYLLVVAWSAVEVFRYPYYIVQIYEFYFPRLMWLRYNVWIPLYPIGILCELYLVYQSIGLVAESGRLTVTMPNRLNVAFDFSAFLKLYLAATSIGGLKLMSYMGSQRTKGLKKLAKLKQMEDIYHKEKDLINIRKKKESKKHA
ncbi:hypothetical protein ACHWQZ_G009324 [Mnemiopsis leidyi]